MKKQIILDEQDIKEFHEDGASTLDIQQNDV